MTEQEIIFGSAKRILGIFEIMLGEEDFELIIENGTIYLRTKDKQNIFKLCSNSIGVNPSDDNRNLILLENKKGEQ